MAAVELNEAFLAKIAGWEVVKQARALLTLGRVLSSNWSPPLLKGVVQEGTTSYRAGLVIKDTINIENLCTCRQARDWGAICPHVVAVGLHHLRRDQAPPPVPSSSKPSAPQLSGFAALKAAVDPPRGPALQFADGENQGTPLELFIMFPPNLDQALARGRVMLFLEAKGTQARGPVGTHTFSRPIRTSQQDRLLLERIQGLTGGEIPPMLQLDASQLVSLLPVLTDHPGLTLGRSTEIEVSRVPYPMPLVASLEPSGEIRLRRSSNTPLPQLLRGEKEQSWAFAKNCFSPFALPAAWASVAQSPQLIPRKDVPIFLSRDWPQLEKAGASAENFKLDEFVVEPLQPKISLHLKGGLAQLQAELTATYGVRVLTVGSASHEQENWMPDPENPKRYWTRDVAFEQAALTRLSRHGFVRREGQPGVHLTGQEPVLHFFAKEYPRMQREWTVSLEERLERSCEANIQRVEPQFAITSSGVQWFDISVSYRLSAGETLAPAEVQRLIRSGKSHSRLNNGKFAIFDSEALEEFQETLRDCSPTQQGQSYRIAAKQAGFLASTVQQQGWDLQAPSDWTQKVRQQSGEVIPPCPELGDLAPILRPYQKHGVAWFQFLRDNEFGGILADEMGLGKTLQTLAFLRAQIRPGAPTTPCLVICPTSLVFNWVAEAIKFAPELKVLALQGTDRAKGFPLIPDHDLVVTSYALIRRDAERYRAIEFDTLILDEAQHIKNRQTQNAVAVKSIRARRRLVLTGTPLENSVFDLWSIFDFLMPGYLGSAQDFKERYELPITREKDSHATTRLSRRLRPFVLRRLKSEVAKDLPSKIEQVSFCDLNEEQRSLYLQVLDAGRKQVLEATGEQGLKQSRMLVLTTLLRLRQICCDLRLLKSGELGKSTASGKVELFGELLQEVLDGGHRVLVFSQFTEMLALLKARLEEDSIDYCYLDGSTKDRGEVVERFQKGAAPVFLISLKAGGVGLNLTAADTVIHFDPWWNPAVEDQATDRAHRIGQSRVVTSYKLIARDTVEEKIVQLQQKKRDLTASTLGGEESFTEALSWQEIQDLLS